MGKPLMPYGSRRNSGLIVKGGGKDQLAGRASARLASDAFNGSGGHLTKVGVPGGGGKQLAREAGASRLVRRNARLADDALSGTGGHLTAAGPVGGGGKSTAGRGDASRVIRMNADRA